MEPAGFRWVPPPRPVAVSEAYCCAGRVLMWCYWLCVVERRRGIVNGAAAAECACTTRPAQPARQPDKAGGRHLAERSLQLGSSCTASSCQRREYTQVSCSKVCSAEYCQALVSKQPLLLPVAAPLQVAASMCSSRHTCLVSHHSGVSVAWVAVATLSSSGLFKAVFESRLRAHVADGRLATSQHVDHRSVARVVQQSVVFMPKC
jgi:hypothetical protein